MRNHSRIIIYIFIALLSVVVMAGAAHAQGYSAWGGWCQGPHSGCGYWKGNYSHPYMYNRQAPVDYRIAGKQQAKIDNIKRRYSSIYPDIKNRIAAKQNEINAEILKQSPDVNRMRRLRNDIIRLRAEFERTRGKEIRELNKILSKKQLKYFGNDFLGNWRNRRWGGWNRWCSYGPYQSSPKYEGYYGGCGGGGRKGGNGRGPRGGCMGGY